MFLAPLLALSVAATPLSAADFGVVGDGTTDDGPAIARAVAALAAAPAPATLAFAPGRIFRVRTAPTTHVLDLRNLHDITVDGGGSEFRLDPSTRFLHLRGCTHAVVRGCSVDFDPLPFADGTVVGVDAAGHWLDVKVADGFALPPLGGPTKVREQAYFGMLWDPGAYSLIGRHYFLDDTREAWPGSLRERVIRAFSSGFGDWAHVRPGQTRISLPVRGIAHKMVGFGASPVLMLEENDGVTLDHVTLWSAPLFACNLAYNRGICTFRHVAIRPRPGRLTSSWRDGFHVKGNRASLLFEDCHLEGMNDDAFNTATHSSTVVAVLSPTEVRLRQTFPLGFVRYEPGDEVGGFSLTGGRRLGPATVVACAPEGATDPANLDRPAVPQRVTLDRPLGLAPGDVVWDATSANPHTVIRRCTILNSCRFQSPVTLEDCEITALCWFYGDNLEGPLPSDVLVRHCRLRQGRGNPDLAVAFASLLTGPDGKPVRPNEPVIGRVRFEDNTFEGRAEFAWVSDLLLAGNRFLTPRGRLALHDCGEVRLRGNRLGEAPLARPEQVEGLDAATRATLRFE